MAHDERTKRIAFSAAREMLALVAPILRPEEQHDFLVESFRICLELLQAAQQARHQNFKRFYEQSNN